MRLSALVFALFLAGCTVARNVAMVHLKTGDIQRCSGRGFGMMGSRLANRHVDSCVREFRALGYKPAIELTSEERAALRPELRKFQFKGEIKNR